MNKIIDLSNRIDEQFATPSPSWLYEHPSEVLNHPTLSVTEKRVILASWASDAWAPESAPWLRCPPGTPRAVPLRDILDALQSLDDDPPPRPGGGRSRRSLIWPFGPTFIGGERS
jgi:hypothetical protein